MISIIVPVYNVESYLDRCVKSILVQTYTDFELLLIDDGSNDRSGVLCLSWQAKDNRIIYVRKKNERQGLTRNLGIRMARGKYISFIDSDDWIAPDFLAQLLTAMQAQGGEMAVCDRFLAYPNREGGEYRLITERSSAWFADREQGGLLWGSGEVSLCNKLFSGELFDRIDVRMPSCYCEDMAIFPHLLAVCNKVAVVKKPLYYYQQGNPNSTMQSKVQLEDILRAGHEALPAFRAPWDAYRFMAYHFFSHGIMVQNGHPRRELEMQEFAQKLLHQLDPSLCRLERTALCFGSFNLRRIGGYALGSPAYLRDFSCSSLISTMSTTPERNIPENLNWYRRRMVAQDLQKTFSATNAEWQGCNLAIIDLLEERLPVVDTGRGFFTMDEGSIETYHREFPADWRVIDCMDEEFLPLWETACQQFIDRLREQFPTNRVILIRSLLMEGYGDYRIDDLFPHQQRIKSINTQLDYMYDYFQRCIPGIMVINPPKELCYTDQDYPYGCHPWHGNDFLYHNIAVCLQHCF